ncbi:MAG: hypothetical protein ACUVTM_08770 [Candidatus Bathyarchaeia archaeon]
MKTAGAITGLTIGTVSLLIACFGLPNLPTFYFIPVWLAISGLIHGYMLDEVKFFSRMPPPINSCIFWAAAFPIYKAIWDTATMNIFHYESGSQFMSVLLWWVIAGFMFGIPFSMLCNVTFKIIERVKRTQI